MTESTAIDRGPCEDCGSSDGCVRYTDGHTHCFVCSAHHSHSSSTPERETRLSTSNRAGLIADLEYVALPKRELTEETCRHWRYGVADGVQVATYCDDGGSPVAQKVRTRDKTFSWRGDAKAAGMFGKHLWRDGGKMLVITEGEIDAMSVSQMQNHKWAVVSVPNGAAGAAAAVKKDIEWLEKFERVVFMLDNDEPGRKAAADCALLLSPGKAYIAQLPLKDANEMLVAGRGAEIVNATWSAKQFRPDGVLAGTDLWDRISAMHDFDALPYPWPDLQAITRGCRVSEIVTVTAGSGVGKSELVRHIASHFHDHHKEAIGYIALEESVERTALGIMGLYLGQRIHLDPGHVSDADKKRAFEATVGSGRYFLYDHWGSLEGDHLLSRIRFMVRGLGCNTIILDHLSIVVSGLETDDERKTIDRLMTKLRSMVQELKFRLIIINHLRRVEGVSHENGGEIALNHLRGSGAIGQLSDIVLAVERDQQDTANSNISKLRVLKNRFTGETGPAGWLQYEKATGRLVPATTPTEPSETTAASAF